jgi:Cof subfamily protein (haloacid dehalogenase superfamily)
MTETSKKSRMKLAAIDLDGTLLGPDLAVSPENLRAVRALQEHGIEVVIASGRHYLSIRQFLAALPEVRWIVSVQGGEISNRERDLILARNFMGKPGVEAALDEAGKLGATPIAYGVDGIYTTVPPNDDLAFYESLSGMAPVQSSRASLSRVPIFKVIWAGTPEQVTAFMAGPGAGLRGVRTHGRIVEFMPEGISKASGLETLAAHLKISKREAVAFGDADNDIPMFRWAGLSYAMAHGWPEAIAGASRTSPAGPPETALARAIDAMLGQESQ